MAKSYARQASEARKRIDDNYNRLISQGYYQYGSQARQIQAEPDYYDDYEEEIVRRRKPRKLPKKAKKAAVEFAFGQKKKTSFLTYAMAFIISSGAIFCLVFMAVVAQRRMDVNFLKAELKQAQQDNYALQASIYDGYDLAEIEAIATSKLKMSKPEEYQIVRISVPEQSYIVQHDTDAEPVKDNFSFGSVYKTIFIKD